MTEIIGVRFQQSSKVYYFDPNGHQGSMNQGVIVETSRGLEFGTITIENVELPEELIPQEPKPIIRLADELDHKIAEENIKLAKDAYDICSIKIQEHNLDMKLVNAEYTFDKNKLIFYFIADDRVDFRDLVRDLAQIFHTRIELRQIGVRDQAKMVGAIGSCGQEVCCKRYMNDFAPVSIKMAKTQGLSLNPTKISGVCGRLMCCLNYEQDVYLENTKKVPAFGTLVLTEEGQGYVVDRDVLQERVRVHIYKDDNTEDEKYFLVDEIEILEKRKKGQPKPNLWDSFENHEFVSEGEKKLQKENSSCCKGGCGSGCKDPKEEAILVYSSEESGNLSVTDEIESSYSSDDDHESDQSSQEKEQEPQHQAKASGDRRNRKKRNRSRRRQNKSKINKQ